MTDHCKHDFAFSLTNILDSTDDKPGKLLSKGNQTNPLHNYSEGLLGSDIAEVCEDHAKPLNLYNVSLVMIARMHFSASLHT